MPISRVHNLEAVCRAVGLQERRYVVTIVDIEIYRSGLVGGRNVEAEKLDRWHEPAAGATRWIDRRSSQGHIRLRVIRAVKFVDILHIVRVQEPVLYAVGGNRAGIAGSPRKAIRPLSISEEKRGVVVAVVLEVLANGELNIVHIG